MAELTGSKDRLGFVGEYRFVLENVITGQREVHYYRNVIPVVGRTMIANNLTSPVPSNTMLITHAALGSSTTAPIESQTILVSETYRNQIVSRTNSSNVAYASAFFNQTETTGTYREAAIFSNATSTPNSGVMMSRVSINVTKTNVQKLTIDWTLTLTSI